MAYTYDDQNIFARILRGDLPCTRVHETVHSLAFEDIAPLAPEHVLVIPKGAYVTYDDFADNASEAEIVDLTRAVSTVIRMIEADPGRGHAGYRILSNAGADGIQMVPHYHVHIFAGRNLGSVLPISGAADLHQQVGRDGHGHHG